MNDEELIREARAAIEGHAPSEAEVLAYRLAERLEAAKAIAPLLNRVRAEALREAAKPFMDRLNGEGNGRAYNSYTVARLLQERAEAIEQNSEGNET